uniref:Phospholipid/glycerol acyltransferase domain-containing protein n=1 Tax=Eptatretus burgeri TaxID=7764 RepID=A0A8C4WVW5_EPTBU
MILEPAMANSAGSYEWGSILQPWMSWLGLDEQGNVLIGLLCFIQPAILFLLLPFMCPIFFLSMEYLSVLFLYVQRYRGLISNNFSYASAEASRKILAKYWCLWSQIWHDYFYFLGRLMLQKERSCRTVADFTVFKIPGLGPLLSAFGVIPGPQSTCVQILESGHLLGISPGGVREAVLSDSNYTVVWRSRTGFAQVALTAGVPIIPMFTKNLQESCYIVNFFRFVNWFYERTGIIFPLIYGFFPVKLCTYIGKPIPHDPSLTASKLAAKTKQAMESLINEHQTLPGNLLVALAERFQGRPKRH